MYCGFNNLQEDKPQKVIKAASHLQLMETEWKEEYNIKNGVQAIGKTFTLRTGIHWIIPIQELRGHSQDVEIVLWEPWIAKVYRKWATDVVWASTSDVS